MKLALFGGSGFIGRNFIEKSLIEGEFTIFGRGKDSEIRIKDKTYVYKHTNYLVENLVEQLKDFDVVINFSSLKVAKHLELIDYMQNAQIADNLMKACIQLDIKQYIHLSSRMVYQVGQELPWNEDSKAIPNSYYGTSKLVSDIILLKNIQNHQTSFKSLRIAQVYGLIDDKMDPKQEEFIIMKFMNLAHNNHNLTVFGKGMGTKDYIYIDDVINAIDLSITSSNSGIYNIGSGSETSYLTLAELIKKHINKEINIIHDNSSHEDTNRTLLDISKAKNELGFEPKWSLEQGIEDMKRRLGWI